MKSLLIAIASVALATTLAGAAGDAGQDAERQLKTAMNTELVDGNLKLAIEQYKKVAESGNRALAAQALIHMAQCYQKLGDAEAQKIYERVVRDYADQTEAVANARARLGGGGALVTAAKGDRAVWTGPKVDLFGRVSPDGRYITYVDWTQFGNVAVHDIVTNADRLLTFKKTWEDLDGGQGGWSAISPDGKQVAYGWQANDKDIRVISLAATSKTEPKRLVTFAGDTVRFLGVRDWSPDGKSLAIWLQRADGTSQIGIASVADGAFRVVKTTDWRGADRMAFSADSRFIAYDLPANDATDQRDVFVLAVDGSGEAAVVVNAADDQIVGWSPDGKCLLFTSDRTGSNALWAVPVANGKPQGPADLLKADIGPASYPLGLTKSGAMFVYKGISTRDVKIAPIDLVAGKLTGPPMPFSQGYLPSPQNPNWSPDGKLLVYQIRNGADAVAIRSIESGHVQRLPRKLPYGREPRFSPDGTALILGGRDSKGRDGIFRIDVKSGDTTPILYASRLGTQPRWSVDGTKIYYKDVASAGRVVERDLSSGFEREMFRHPQVGEFQLSPDGRLLAVQTDVDPVSHSAAIQVISVADASARELVRIASGDFLAQAQTFAWAPDSKAMLLAKNAGGRAELWSVDIATGQSRKFEIDTRDWTLTSFISSGATYLDAGFSLSPDGRQIAFLTGKSAVEVWALENFLPGQAAAHASGKR